MYLNKYPLPCNFRFLENMTFRRSKNEATLANRRASIRVQILGDDLLRVTLMRARAPRRNYSEAGLRRAAPRSCGFSAEKGCIRMAAGDMEITLDPATGAFACARDGHMVLRSAPSPFGVCGPKTVLLIERPEDAVVYGLGEKTGGLDKSAQKFKMWNVDVWADLPGIMTRDDYDPSYVSIPFVISKWKDSYYGIYLDNPFATFFHTGHRETPGALIASGDPGAPLAIGAEEGLFDCYLIPGPTLADVARRFARLTGTHEQPPAWALGYHQCRWGYASAKEIADVARRLARARIPVGALWMDIDYMDGFRVFTFHPERFSPEERERCFASIRKRGTRLVTIIDPGVKVEKKFPVYREGLREDVFCKTPEKTLFHGYVWPGKTVFPDFTLERTREFWARHVADHLREGIDGIWNDMNDPSCGSSDPMDMSFEGGKTGHAAYHNQYGHLMARATWEGFQRHDPNHRPFILTRSGCTGTQKYAAVWTGDNVSSEAHLAMSIPMSINLALSGISFNGADIGGFAHDTTEDLFIAWTQAGMLFPFARNHSAFHTRPQEPYAFSTRALDIFRKCVNTRCKLLPYLYTQFALHRRDGDAVMRPLAYEFPGEQYERIGDQYLIGPSLMVAPFVDVSSATRDVVLPPGWWFSLQTGRWVRGGRTIRVRRTEAMIVFVRDGSILPCLDGADFYPQPDFRRMSLHVFSKSAAAAGELYEDDRETRDYQRGVCNWVRAEASDGKTGLHLRLERGPSGYSQGVTSFRVYYHGLHPRPAEKTSIAWPFGNHAGHVETLALPFA